MKNFKFTSTRIIAAETLSEAKRMFKEDSKYFAANHECIELKEFQTTIPIDKLILQRNVGVFNKGELVYRFNAINWFIHSNIGVKEILEDCEELEKYYKETNNF